MSNKSFHRKISSDDDTTFGEDVVSHDLVNQIGPRPQTTENPDVLHREKGKSHGLINETKSMSSSFKNEILYFEVPAQKFNEEALVTEDKTLTLKRDDVLSSDLNKKSKKANALNKPQLQNDNSRDLIIKDNSIPTKHKTPACNEDESRMSHQQVTKDRLKLQSNYSNSREETFVLRPIIIRNFLTQIELGYVPNLSGIFVHHLLTNENLYIIFERKLSSIWYDTTNVTNPEGGSTFTEGTFLLSVKKHHNLIKSEIDKHDTMRRFERKKDLILASVPSNIKDDFMTVCFGMWGEEAYPALQINPFDIIPGEVTKQWMNMHAKVS